MAANCRCGEKTFFLYGGEKTFSHFSMKCVRGEQIGGEKSPDLLLIRHCTVDDFHEK